MKFYDDDTLGDMIEDELGAAFWMVIMQSAAVRIAFTDCICLYKDHRHLSGGEIIHVYD